MAMWEDFGHQGLGFKSFESERHKFILALEKNKPPPLENRNGIIFMSFRVCRKGTGLFLGRSEFVKFERLIL